MSLYHKIPKSGLAGPDRITHMEVDLRSDRQVIFSTTTAISVLDLDTKAVRPIVGNTSVSADRESVESDYDTLFEHIRGFVQISRNTLLVVEKSGCIRQVNISQRSTSMYAGQCNDISTGSTEARFRMKFIDTYKIERDNNSDVCYTSSRGTIRRFFLGNATFEDFVETVELYFISLQLDPAAEYLYLISSYSRVQRLTLATKRFVSLSLREGREIGRAHV